MKAALLPSIDNTFIQKAYVVCLFLFCVSIFLPWMAATNISIGLLIVVWLFEGEFRIKLNKIKSAPLALTSITLFLLYVVGLIYTENLQAGTKYLETKASLIIFPVILTSAQIHKKNLKKTLSFFSWACIFFSFIALLHQIKIVEERNDINYFFSDGLVMLYEKRAVYFSIYVAFSIIVLLNEVRLEFSSSSKLRQAILLVALAFLFLISFLLAARTTLIFLMIVVIITALVLGAKNGNKTIAALFLATVILFFSTLSVFFPQVFSRFESLKNYSFNFQNQSSEFHFAFENTPESWNGLNLRLAKWICAIDIIKENPIIGVGTGDTKDELVDAYQNRKFYYAVEKRFDPHNQYLETTVGVGMVGLLVLCLFYFYPLYLSLRKKYWLFAAFSCLVIICSITESLLSSFQGIIFICFFMFIFIKILEDDVKEHTKAPTPKNF